MLWVGLGNPGDKFVRNRHNIGFMIIDKIAESYNFSSWSEKFSCKINNGIIFQQKIILAKPQKFMNNSGLPITKISNYFSIPSEEIFVFHDEIDLDQGKIKIKFGGGNSGHNGLKNIDQHLTNNYWRVRLGVGKPKEKSCVNNWVLGNFSKKDENSWLIPLLDAITNEVHRLILKDTNGFMSRVRYLSKN